MGVLKGVQGVETISHVFSVAALLLHSYQAIWLHFYFFIASSTTGDFSLYCSL